jgi:uncharacterized damage-inducible protein DinB
MSSLPEPWLRGPLDGVHPLIAPVLYSMQQAREDLARHTEGLTVEQIWARPFDLAPVGFQLRHIAGSIERLATYLGGGRLSESQLAALKREMEPGAGRDELLEYMERALASFESQVRAIDPATLAEPRMVGRDQLPATVHGLLVHIAEHTQRHAGQAISAAKLARRV